MLFLKSVQCYRRFKLQKNKKWISIVGEYNHDCLSDTMTKTSATNNQLSDDFKRIVVVVV